MKHFIYITSQIFVSPLSEGRKEESEQHLSSTLLNVFKTSSKLSKGWINKSLILNYYFTPENRFIVHIIKKN